MAYRIFTIPIALPESGLRELNAFLSQNQVVEVDRQFVQLGAQAFWWFCLNYVAGQQPTPSGNGAKSASAGRVDYKEVLDDGDFIVFAKLRDLRKQIADELTLPLFAIFSNEQLAELSRRRVTSLKQLTEIGLLADNSGKFGRRIRSASEL